VPKKPSVSPDTPTSEPNEETLQTGAVAPEEPPVEQVKHLGDALKRLAQGAGKKDQWDTVLIEENKGRSCNGVVTTEIVYPFGFEARLVASTLRSTLAHLMIPEVKAETTGVTFREGGKRFRLSQLVRDAEIPSWSAPASDQLFPAHGSWMTRLLPILPNTVGHHMFPGVWVGPQGYVGTDSKILAWIEAPGPLVPGIVPKQFVERMPLGPIQLGLDTTAGVVWANEEGTTWTGLLLAGNYPDWRGAFFEPDRHIIVERKALLESLRAITTISRTAILATKGDPRLFHCASDSVIDLRARGTKGSSAETTIPTIEYIGDPFTVRIDAAVLLAALEKTTGSAILIGTEARMDRIIVRPTEMQPAYHLVLIGIVGYGAL